MSGATLPGERPASVPGDPELRAGCLAVLESTWREPGFCVPNAMTYPWQWLWDSCFHAVCWARLGRPDRAVTELANLLAHQADDGFVPHMTYWHDGDTHAGFWGRSGTSAITQPPMYGHAVAELSRLGVAVPDEVVARAASGLHFLLTRRRRGRSVVIVHPWESGCDDSPRWDAWASGTWSSARWKVVKGELVESLDLDHGSPVGNLGFEVASAGFSALVAFNARELATVTGDRSLQVAADDLVGALDERWDPDRRTWADEVVEGSGATRAVRTLDALLPALVSDDPAAVGKALADALDGTAFGGPFGPAATHRDEPAFDPFAYWRGPAWPQLTYLLWLAAERAADGAAADDLAGRLVAGARRSGLAEYWHPDTGAGLGAVPQSWAALAAVVDQAPRA